MSKSRKRGEEIRSFILEHVDDLPRDIAALTAKSFGISRQAVNKHIQKLVKQEALHAHGATRNRSYTQPVSQWKRRYFLKDELAEHVVWRTDIAPLLKDLSANALDVWLYGFTEIFNNAIDHASAKIIDVSVKRSSTKTQIIIYDDGEGIFKKIRRVFDLYDLQHAVLELSKGKLTTDTQEHSGQGVFFTSRVFDHFAIMSENIYFSHQHDDPEDLIAEIEKLPGTGVIMELDNHATRTTREIFDLFSSGDGDYSFSKTIVPVRLAQYEKETLVSRSQAKRLLTRIDKFQTIIFDFEHVHAIGQAFADEIFRVFANSHPDIKLGFVNANKAVEQMISRATSDCPPPLIDTRRR